MSQDGDRYFAECHERCKQLEARLAKVDRYLAQFADDPDGALRNVTTSARGILRAADSASDERLEKPERDLARARFAEAQRLLLEVPSDVLLHGSLYPNWFRARDNLLTSSIFIPTCDCGRQLILGKCPVCDRDE